MKVELQKSWKNLLHGEIEQPYFKQLESFVTSEYSAYECYPPENQIFSALHFCDFEAVKVVVIGQDPYHDVGQANGLCFSVNENMTHPPSLKNIFKEIELDLGISYPNSGNLKRWAEQGVLLLNATLTVRAHNAGSHQNQGWEIFTNAIIKTISDQREHIVFLLWGGFAKKKAKLISLDKHHVLMSGHPSPLSANRGYWFGNRHFSKTNEILLRYGLAPIQW